MHNPFEPFLRRQAAVILDGALATELERRGADLTDPLWSSKCLMERPDLIRAVHLDYFHAGADVATTATYQSTFEGFARRGLDSRAAARLMRDATSLAMAARDDFWSSPVNRAQRLRPLVAASIGPFGAMLADGSEYRGRYSLSDDQLREFHLPRLRVLAESGAELLAIETIPCLREALVVARLLREFSTLSAWISFSCQDGRHNCEGEEIEACAHALQPFGEIAAVGINCSRPAHVESLLARMRGATDKPLLAYPNSGEFYEPAVNLWDGEREPYALDAMAAAWHDAGARLIGGCCRTGPEDIAALRRRFAPLPADPAVPRATAAPSDT